MAFPLQILSIVGTIIDRIIPDKAAAEKAKQELAKADLDAEIKLALGQIEVNKVEAAHSSVFVAGWRPYIGWVCGTALAYHAVVKHIIVLLITIYNGGDPNSVSFDMDTLGYILGALLGLGWARTYEKKLGVNK